MAGLQLLFFSANETTNWIQRISISVITFLYLLLLIFIIQQNFWRINDDSDSKSKIRKTLNKRLSIAILLYVISNLFTYLYVHIIVYDEIKLDCHTLISISIAMMTLSGYFKYYYLFIRLELLFNKSVGFHYNKKFIHSLKFIYFIIMGLCCFILCSNIPEFSYNPSMYDDIQLFCASKVLITSVWNNTQYLKLLESVK